MANIHSYSVRDNMYAEHAICYRPSVHLSFRLIYVGDMHCSQHVQDGREKAFLIHGLVIHSEYLILDLSSVAAAVLRAVKVYSTLLLCNNAESTLLLVRDGD